MKYYVDITDTLTKETRRLTNLEASTIRTQDEAFNTIIDDPDVPPQLEGLTTKWSTSGWSCDCNRSFFFSLAKSSKKRNIISSPCGGNRFSIVIRREGDDLLLYKDN